MKKSAVLVCQLVVKKLIGNDPCNFKILGVHASLTSQSGQISIRKAPKMDVIHFFFWVFLVQTHFPSIVSPVFLFFGSTSLNPTEKILRSWEWREDAHHKIVKLDQLNQLMFETRSKIGETSMGNQPSLGSLGFRNLMQKSHGGYEGELWRVIPLAEPLRTFKVGEPQSSKTWRLRRLPWGKLTESDPSEAKKRGLVRCDCLKALKE